jgi:hypothetical protein
LANSSSPREAKRENSAAVSTGAGTPSSIAACDVQRPSPESETRPEKFSSAGLCASAAAVRSSSHDPTTLPRRQTSAISGMSKSYWYSSGLRSGVVSASISCSARPMSALSRMFRPSANAAIIPYSIPLWTIFTKWPAPLGPQCSQPCSAGAGSPSRPGVRSAASTPGASDEKNGSRRSTAVSSPPIIRQ